LPVFTLKAIQHGRLPSSLCGWFEAAYKRFSESSDARRPTQQAVIAALGDVSHVQLEKDIYRKRREVLLGAVRSYGFELSDSEAGLYLWATLNEDCWITVEKMAQLGIVVVPGSFYGAFATKHVRFSLTATDEDIARAADRLENALG
jgi:aspartate/methionine/tyrosine aminotransferase